MIPQWETAAQGMLGMLKEGGSLAIIDFTTREGQAGALAQRFYKWWFAHDGVWLREEQNLWLRENLDTLWFSEAEHRLPYTPFSPTHYLFHGKKLAKGAATAAYGKGRKGGAEA